MWETEECKQILLPTGAPSTGNSPKTFEPQIPAVVVAEMFWVSKQFRGIRTTPPYLPAVGEKFGLSLYIHIKQ